VVTHRRLSPRATKSPGRRPPRLLLPVMVGGTLTVMTVVHTARRCCHPQGQLAPLMSPVIERKELMTSERHIARDSVTNDCPTTGPRQNPSLLRSLYLWNQCHRCFNLLIIVLIIESMP